MSIKIAMIGAGAIGERHVAAAKETGIAISHVVDQDLARAKQLADTHSAEPIVDVGELWTDPTVDAVIVGVPNWLHKPLAVAALRAGKDVLLEKPMGLNVAECEEINTASTTSGKLVQIGLVHRYSAVVREVKRMFDEDELGRIYHVKAQMFRRRGVPGLGGWFTTKAKSGGGALIDIGVHLLDIGMHLSGFSQPIEVSGKAYSIFGARMKNYVYDEMWAGPPNYNGVCDVDDSACALVRLDGGTTLELNVTWAGNFSEEVLPEYQIVVMGERAGASFALFGDHVIVAKEQDGKNTDEHIDVSGPDLFSEQITDFARAITDRRIGGATGEQGATIQALIDAIYKSSDTERAIPF